MNDKICIKEARRLAKTFPDRFTMYAALISRNYSDLKELVWNLEERTDYSSRGKVIARNYTPWLGDEMIPLSDRQPCMWHSFNESHEVIWS